MADGIISQDENSTQQSTLPQQQSTSPLAEQTPAPFFRKRQASLTFTPEEEEDIVTFILERFKADENERQDWMIKRLDQIAKTNGWLPDKNWPFENSSNIWPPVIATACYRVISTLYNAVLGNRPVVQSKALERRDEEKQNRIDRLLDFQVFEESFGEMRLDDFINHFVFDGLAIAHTAYVKETRTVNDVHILPGNSLIGIIPELFKEMIQKMFQEKGTKVVSVAPISDDKWTWKVELQIGTETQSATVDFYQRDDELIEAHVRRPMTIHDGPVFNVEELENIVVPARCSNLQPPGPANPNGAPYVNRLFMVRMDDIRQRRDDGRYDLITDEKWTSIQDSKPGINTNSTQAEQTQEERDVYEGTRPQIPGGMKAQDRFYPVEGIEHYGRWIVNKDEDGNGEEVDVIFWVLKDSKQLVRARYLTDIYPGIPATRPFAEARFIPVPNRFYATGLRQLLEPIQDLIKALLDSNVDWGTVRNMPFFFYRASSGLAPEVIRLQPGEGYPVDNPSQDINFPQWGNTDNSWIFNTLALAERMGEKLAMESDVNYGRVPAGKASALRTTGTTVALLQQGDVRSEQILRRLFFGIVQIYESFHRLNQRWLPKEKHFRIFGMPKEGEDPYQTATPDQVSGDVKFIFKATMLNTNKQAVAQALTEAIGISVSPLALQLGITTKDNVYRLFRDKYKQNDLDYESYVTPPSPQADKPVITVQEAISMIADGFYPYGTPAEGLEVHFEKLREYQAGIDLGWLNTPEKVNMLASYIRDIILQLRQQLQQAQLMQAAQQMQQFVGQQTQGNGGVPTTIQQPPQRGPTNGGMMPEAGG